MTHSDWTIEPVSSLRGQVTVPGDKSVSHRALLFAALATGTSTISNLLLGEDVLGTMRLLQHMGVSMSHTPDSIKGGDILTVHGVGLNGLRAPAGILDCGNSGTTMRLMIGLLAAQPFDSILTGDASLNKRPMDRVMDPLKQMGAQFEIKQVEGRRLIIIKGSKSLKAINYLMPVASAQVKSALILAGLYAHGETVITEKEPTRDHTERMLSAMGAPLTVAFPKIKVLKATELKASAIIVPGDFSSAAFFIVAGLIVPKSEVEVLSVGINPTRAGLVDILKKMGADINLKNQRLVSGEPVADILVRSSRLSALHVSGDVIANIIDEIPILSVAMLMANGTSEVSDAQELRVKESDRIRTLALEMTKMGVKFTEKRDGFFIEAKESWNGASFNSHGDHRIAMSFAVASLLASQKSRICNTACVATSFPGFYDLLISLMNK